MEKRAFIAVVLSMTVLMGYQYLFVPPTPVVDEKMTSSAAPAAQETAAATPAEQPRADIKADAPPVKTLATAAVPDLPGKEIRVETSTVSAVIDTKGGYIKSWVLKAYKDASREGKGIDLAPAGKGGLKFSREENGAFTEDSLVYASDKEGLAGPGIITLQAVRADGIRVVRTFQFADDSYKAKIKVIYQNETANQIIEKLSVSIPYLSDPAKQALLYYEMAYLSGKELKRTYINKLANGKVTSGEMDWVYMGDKYFMNGIIPSRNTTIDLSSKKVSDIETAALLSFPSMQMAGGEARNIEFEIFFGPKDIDLLKVAGSKLERTIDLGFFDLVGYPLLLALKWVYRYVPNYGLVIILLALILKIVFWPLSQKSYKAMKDMQKLAPMMEQLKEKYKDDKERLNREIFDLYKRYKVNPLGGCLPMLLQIPIFVALNAVLGGAVELRHAPFILWVTDLSVKDPYYVYPVLMGASMFVQQKMTPSTATDPMQQKVMMLMPVFLTVMFLNFSSGLVLYWFVSNILSIGQQYYVNKTIK